MNSPIKHRLKMEVTKKDKQNNLLPRNKESNNLIAPPVTDDQPLNIDLVESDDDESRYSVWTNKGAGVDASIYDLDDSMWTNE